MNELKKVSAEVERPKGMKAEELMIGDLCRINCDGLCIKKGTTVEVRAVNADDVLCSKVIVGSTHCRPLDEGQFDGGIWCEYLDPIPITPEILEKNGFEKQGFPGWEIFESERYMILWRNDYPQNHLRISSFCSLYGDYSAFNIDYVHQLQHALRLCGIEKEIVL